jgi:hypothetical protein
MLSRGRASGAAVGSWNAVWAVGGGHADALKMRTERRTDPSRTPTAHRSTQTIPHLPTPHQFGSDRRQTYGGVVWHVDSRRGPDGISRDHQAKKARRGNHHLPLHLMRIPGVLCRRLTGSRAVPQRAPTLANYKPDPDPMARYPKATDAAPKEQSPDSGPVGVTFQKVSYRRAFD